MSRSAERSASRGVNAAQRAEQTVEVVKTARAEQVGVGRHQIGQTCEVISMEGHLFENPEEDEAAPDARSLGGVS